MSEKRRKDKPLPPHAALIKTLVGETATRYNELHLFAPWSAEHPDMQTAWTTCERGDWMLWLMLKLAEKEPVGSPIHRRAIKASILCLRANSRYEEFVGEVDSNVRSIEEWTQNLPGAEDTLRTARTSTPLWFDLVQSLLHMVSWPALIVSRGMNFCHSAEMSHPGSRHAYDLLLANLLREAFPHEPTTL